MGLDSVVSVDGARLEVSGCIISISSVVILHAANPQYCKVSWAVLRCAPSCKRAGRRRCQRTPQEKKELDTSNGAGVQLW